MTEANKKSEKKDPSGYFGRRDKIIEDAQKLVTSGKADILFTKEVPKTAMEWTVDKSDRIADGFCLATGAGIFAGIVYGISKLYSDD